jgi:hypothetical protein
MGALSVRGFVSFIFFGWGWEPGLDAPPPSNILCYCISFANTGAVVRQMHVHARVRVCGGGRGKVKYNTMTFPLGGGGSKRKKVQ